MTSYMMRLTTLDGKEYDSNVAEYSDEEFNETVEGLRRFINEASTINFNGLTHNGDKVPSLILPTSQIARIEVL